MQRDVVAFPTETVYGLGANVFDEKALRKIFAAKKRPIDNPFIVHIHSVGDIELLAKRITPSAEKFITHFFPGPLTVVLPKNSSVPMIATAGLSTIAIRMPHHPIAQSLLRECGVPLAAPSANLSGKPSPTTWHNVLTDMDGRISCILKGGQTRVGLESTVVDCTGKVPVVLRSGAVTLEQLRGIVPSTRMSVRKDKGQPRSPGMKYRHYSPKARVIIVSQSAEAKPSRRAAYIGLTPFGRSENFLLRRMCRTPEEYAHALFAFFRECDEEKISTIYCQSIESKGIGLALMDRIRRASH